MTLAEVLFFIFATVACLAAVAVVVSRHVVHMAFWLIVSLGSTAVLFFLLGADFVGATQLLVYVGGTLVLLVFGVMLTASGPFMKIRTAPGEAILACGVGLLFLALVVWTGTAVDWNVVALKSLTIADDAFESVLRSPTVTDEQRRLLDAWYVPMETDQLRYRLRQDATPTPKEAQQLVAVWQQADLLDGDNLTGPGTTRPIGLSLLGFRPDRDLDSADGRLTPGYLLPFEIASVHLLVVLVGAAYLARAKRRVSAQSE